MFQLCLILIAASAFSAASPAPRVRIDRDGYDIEGPHMKVQFALGHKSLTAFIEDTHNKMTKLSRNLGAEHPDSSHYPGAIPPEDLPQDHQVDHSYDGSEAAAVRVMDSPLFFDTVHHEKMVRHYARRREDEGLSPLYFHSIRPGFPFYDQEQRRPNQPHVPFTSFFTTN